MSRSPSKSTGAVSSVTALCVFLALTVGVFVFLSVSLMVRGKGLSVLRMQRDGLLKELKLLRADQRTGMLAISILSELEGWNRISQVPLRQLEHFFDLPPELSLEHIFIDRSFLYRPLPENLQTPFFTHALAVPGDVSVDLVDSGTGNGKYVFPSFLDRINFDMSSSFKNLPQDEDDEELEPSFNRWRLSASLEKEFVWHPITQ